MVSTLKTMTQVDFKPGIPSVKKDSVSKGDISGIMGLSGPSTKISIAMTFPMPVIERIANKILPPDMPKTTGALADLVGELNNIIAGAAKQILADDGFKFEMSLPVIIIGAEHIITHKAHGPSILLPVSSDLGGFYVEICYET
jgi:chemotaxis protein CheX